MRCYNKGNECLGTGNALVLQVYVVREGATMWHFDERVFHQTRLLATTMVHIQDAVEANAVVFPSSYKCSFLLIT